MIKCNALLILNVPRMVTRNAQSLVPYSHYIPVAAPAPARAAAAAPAAPAPPRPRRKFAGEVAGMVIQGKQHYTNKSN